MLGHVGRKRIYTDYKYIDESNILSVLGKAYSKHCANVSDMDFLIDYEAGIHPAIRDREKKIREDIDYKVVDNIAHYVSRFHIGYFWGTPAMYIQRGNQEIHASDEVIDDTGITGLNEMLRNGTLPVVYFETNRMQSEMMGHRGNFQMVYATLAGEACCGFLFRDLAAETEDGDPSLYIYIGSQSGSPMRTSGD